MPNTPTIIREGATVFTCGSHIKEGDNRLIQSLFSKLGICIEGDESIIDAAMAVSGCGPAYVSYLYIVRLYSNAYSCHFFEMYY